jgi:two-component system phosphate regulon sensor histidine kinase PhoR
MLGKTKILLVDDEKRFRETWHRLLTGRGYDVITAENGQIALDILSNSRANIIILEQKIPVISGEDTLEIINTKYPNIPVIIITGNGTIDSAVECMKKGAYDFITKPFQIDQLLFTIKRAEDKRTLEQKARMSRDMIIRILHDLNAEKKRLKTIINCMANGVMVTNRNLEVVLHNPVVMRLMEMSERIANPFPINRIINDELLINTIKKIVNGESPENEFISQEISVGNNVLRAITAPSLAPDKDLFWTVDGAVTVLEDITAFKQLDQMKTDFVNMVVHELRSPLVAIKQQNNVLLEGLCGPLEEKQQEFVSRGSTKIDSLLELINDLLDVAKIEVGKYVQHRVPTDIGKIIEETVGLMESRAEEKGIALTFSLKDLKSVQADPKNIEEIFNNLISNAINYSPEGGQVMVTAQGFGEYMEIKVEDTGVGIPPEELPKIFDKFYRVKHPKTRQVTGTGLGLAIVKGIVDAHQGTIDVESVVDKGTIFRILLPVITG